MDEKKERCIICGEEFSEDDEKVYCPDCAAPMHKDCCELAGGCPNNDNHGISEEKAGGEAESNNDNGIEVCGICGKEIEDGERVNCPDCGEPMHRVCYNLTHRCPNAEKHENASVHEKKSAKNGTVVCGLCGEPFRNGEDKAYCPECGTPVHIECWQREHRCPNEDKHALGYDWDKENGGNSTAAYNEERKSHEPSCDICGEEFEDDDDIIVCPECGTPMHRECWDETHVCPNADKHGTGYDWNEVHRAVNGTRQSQQQIFTSFEDFTRSITETPVRSNENGEELTCCGVKQGELLHFLGTRNLSTPRFFALFLNMANTRRKISFNIAAGLFMPLYHFYRRMTGPAVIITIATFILTIPSFVYLAMLSGSNVQNVTPQFVNIANITSFIAGALQVASLLFNDYIYMKWSVGKILSLREKYKDAPQEDYYAALEKKGNPRFVFVLGGISLILLLAYVLRIVLGSYGIL